MKKLTPVQVKGIGGAGLLTNVKAVTGGFMHCLALRTDGTVVAWGRNSNGEVGDGTTTQRLTPVQVKGVGGAGFLSNATAVTGASTQGLALRGDGTVVGWGENADGELGDGTTTQRPAPVQVKGVGGAGFLDNVTAICGSGHVLALRGDGTVVSWGNNGPGSLGDGTTTKRLTPVQVKGVGGAGVLTNVVAVMAAGWHSLALRADGTVVAWGENDNGQLGDGTTTEQHVPVQVKGVGGAGFLSNVIALAATTFHSLALRADGTVVTWGRNDRGQLGDGTTTEQHVPVQVKGVGGAGFLTDVVSLGSASELHSLALRGDGTAVAWGYNGQGNLGDGSTTNRHTPVQVQGLNGITTVNMSASNSLATA